MKGVAPQKPGAAEPFFSHGTNAIDPRVEACIVADTELLKKAMQND